MPPHLVLTVRLHDRRYHGTGDWPPAPARVFQALVAGVARGGQVPDGLVAALEWLEGLPAPVIAAPRASMGERVDLFVPNNDADSVGGDPASIGEIRTKKLVRPRLLDGDTVVYAWPLAAPSEHAKTIVTAAGNLYQLGRGVDMAWATGDVLDDDGLGALLSTHRGTVHRPSDGDGKAMLACPTPGSLASLVLRHKAGRHKLSPDPAKAGSQLFQQPPRARFVPVAYDGAAREAVFELRRRGDDSGLAPWPLARVVSLIERLRDGATARLGAALGASHPAVARALVGRKPDGENAGPIGERVRIVPLPSTGHEHADRAVRRVLVEVPPGCPLGADDVFWAFSGLEPCDPATGVADEVVLAPTEDLGMLQHYRRASRVWRTVTPAALPERAARRRIEPTRRREEAKGAAERSAEEQRAASAVRTALRHAGVGSEVVAVRVQREPLERKGTRAESFAPGTRFAKERLWHVEVELADAIEGPLAIGDGRFLGLGLMTPARGEASGLLAFEVDGGYTAEATPAEVARALRRAVMALVQKEVGRGALPAYFTGHDEHGEPARSADRPHLAFHAEPGGRLVILAPHALLGREPTAFERDQLELLDRAVVHLGELRAGASGLLSLRRVALDEADPLLAPSTTWVSVTSYLATRHAKADSASRMIADDVTVECARRGLPQPKVTVEGARGVSGRGVEARLRLEFAVACRGPIALGRSRHLGGGLFAGQPEPTRKRG